MDKQIIFDCDGTLIDTRNFKYVLYPGVRELLLALASQYTLHVWTARDRISTLRILQDQKVISFFDGISTADDALPKPHILGLANLVGASNKAKVCVIGDSTNDILGAKNFGVKSIGATWNEYAKASVLSGAGADFIASSPGDCLRWLTQNIT